MNSGEILYSKGKNDECYTPDYGVKPILKYIPNDKIVWCPFDKENSEFVKQISEQNKVIYSHIDSGQDFFTYEPERWDIIISNPPFCFDDKVELLTVGGWINIKNIKNGVNTLTVNPETQELSYSKVINTEKKRYKGKMFKLMSKYVDLLITPNHRIIAYNKKGELLKDDNDLFAVKDLPHYDVYMKLTGYSFEGNDMKDIIIPEYTHVTNKKKRKIYYPERKIDIDSWLAFFGFWLADGSVSGSNGGKNKLSVMLKQHKKNHKKVCSILDNLGLNYKYYYNKNDTINYDINSAQFNNYMSKFGNSYKKYIPRNILNLPSKRLKILLQYYVFGDCTTFCDNGGSLSTVSSQLSNDLTEISLKTGKILSMIKKKIKYNGKPYTIYQGNLIKDNSKNKRCKLLYNKIIKEEYYNNYVYAVEVKYNKTIVVRRNGRVFITGNSNKKLFFERALSFGKPFALIMSITWLNDAAPKQIFKNKEFELLMFDKRIRFINPSGQSMGSPTFSSAYFCHKFLPKQIIMEELMINKRINNRQHGML